MSNDNIKAKLFKFGVYQGDNILCEVSDSAEKFNPAIRNSVKIRGDIFQIINKLSKVLSQQKYNTVYGLGKDNKSLNFKKLAGIEIEKYPKFIKDDIYFGLKPKVKANPYNEYNVGVECKFVLYINNYTIVERDFYVEGYNSDVKYSTDIIDVCEDILGGILDKLRKEDINFAWENKDINDRFGLNYMQIFELSQEQRSSYIKQIYK